MKDMWITWHDTLLMVLGITTDYSNRWWLNLPGSKVSVYINEEYVSDTNMRIAINNKEHGKLLIKYLQDKHKWDDDAMQTIYWECFQEVMEKRPIHKSTNIIKYIHGWQHVGSQKFLFKDTKKEAKCILCNQEEVQHHYLVCRCEKWITECNKIWKTLKTNLKIANTYPCIIAIIGHIIFTNSMNPHHLAL